MDPRELKDYIFSDSLYFACSASTLEHAVTEERKPVYETLKAEFLALHKDPYDACYDQRTPGKFISFINHIFICEIYN